MPEELFAATDVSIAEELRLTSARLSDRKYGIRHRLAVVGCGPIDIVRAAGGVIVDRLREGWDAVALLTEEADHRPLRILGAEAINIDSERAEQVKTEVPHAMLIANELMRDNASVQQWVLQVLEESLTSMAAFSDSWSGSVDAAYPMRHRLSRSARIFKAEALRAAHASEETITETELFCTVAVSSTTGAFEQHQWARPTQLSPR